MNTKLKGDLAEIEVQKQLLLRKWAVSIPIGDRLPYDLIIDVKGKLLKIQVKAAWYDSKKKYWCVSFRKTKSNRRKTKFAYYDENDFNFCIVVLIELDVFYIFPIDFCTKKAMVTLVENRDSQRLPESIKFREAWHLLTPNEPPIK